MNHAALDRLLCERLGIEGTSMMHRSADGRGRKPCISCGAVEWPIFSECYMEYPALSTTWDGMGKLIEALHCNGWGYQLGSDSGPTSALVYGHEKASRSDGDTPLIALALAATGALGIEVPE